MDTNAHFRSLASEITAIRNRVQNLIGPAHWPTVGAAKESVLRSIIRRHLPPSLHVGSGFILSPDGQSSQIDILIYDERAPVLFKDGDLVILTPDSVRGVIEVKTRLSMQEFKNAVSKLDEIATLMRLKPRDPAPFFGLFAYEGPSLNDAALLSALKEHNGRFGSYVINFVSIGIRQFVRFWQFPPNGPARRYSCWHSYDLDGLAQAYFIHNIIDYLFPESVVSNNALWFPFTGKESALEATLPRDAAE